MFFPRICPNFSVIRDFYECHSGNRLFVYVHVPLSIRDSLEILVRIALVAIDILLSCNADSVSGGTVARVAMGSERRVIPVGEIPE